MASERELALELLPHFASNVLAKRCHTYGYYANAIGRQPSESITIGKAMHAVGVGCVFASIPVAPLFYVRSAGSRWRGIFEADRLEREKILPYYDLLQVTAREYKYSERNFNFVGEVLRDILPKFLPEVALTPHQMWHVALRPSENGTSFFSRAVASYQELIDIWK